MDALIVFSHPPWRSVWQRPQHLITRFARRWPVLFVEEPSHTSGPPRAEQEQVHPGVTVLRPRTPIEAGGFHDRQLPAIRPMLQDAVAALRSARYGVCTFTPMALPLMQDLDPVTIAYDCMDELSAFRFAPRQLPQRESALLHVATSCSPAGLRSIAASGCCTTTSTVFRAAWTPRTSPAAATRRPRTLTSRAFRGRAWASTA